MKTTLYNIATIQTGLFEKTVSKGDIVYLQGKHFDENGKLLYSLTPDLISNNRTKKHLLKVGDILFAAKGTRNFAAVYESHNPPSIASTSFFVIRLNTEKVLPHYLAWYLNHSDTQNFLKSYARGSSIPSISKAVLVDMQIPIPSIETQEAVIKIAALRKQETNIKNQLEELQEKYIQHLLLNSIQQ